MAWRIIIFAVIELVVVSDQPTVSGDDDTQKACVCCNIQQQYIMDTLAKVMEQNEKILSHLQTSTKELTGKLNKIS